MVSTEVIFVDYEGAYFFECLRLFDENCPQYFAKNEKSEYVGFLKSNPQGYVVAISEEKVVAAFGLIDTPDARRARLSWIMVSPNSKGSGMGMKMITHAKSTAIENEVAAIDIAASHLSAPFFQKFGAAELNEVPNGWGPGMQRIDMELRL